ncbi:WXG100 family type VII secretion target [Mycolicibacterium austroafricanum]|jgi:uncharacterized protein YukE|uniref:WXG100 family type VII secretion target n=1 Tax=Mycolicibacterium austroafricanum TaxID=39687 RepID=A0ABT8HKL8_MYCAO|nr:WXG100 family type VII secretion target [Mycolicibacterium austroafricanum]MDN4521279.1 WXG100 family type VII secretion target [Mycolicibacterium austroafricanum]QRZ08166.1 WXG100 family type VII secretion target [Mycolicibacterium austroafricanum]
MAFTGADVAQLQQLSGQLNAKAGDIQSIVSQLTSAINSVDWRGPDAERFKSDWQGQHVAQLKQVINALQAASQRAMQNAQQQEAASS